MRRVTKTSDLKHKVLNDYNLVVACIFLECSRTDSAEVKAALSRVENFVHDLASSLREHT
jgi:two-component sensor histidine kinase